MKNEFVKTGRKLGAGGLEGEISLQVQGPALEEVVVEQQQDVLQPHQQDELDQSSNTSEYINRTLLTVDNEGNFNVFFRFFGV